MLPLAAWAPNRAVAAAVLMAGSAIMNAFSLVYNILQVSLRQRLCPRPLLGRMNASIRWIVWGLWPPASLLAGWLGQHWGLVPTLWVGALSSLVAFVTQVRLGDAIRAVESRRRRHEPDGTPVELDALVDPPPAESTVLD